MIYKKQHKTAFIQLDSFFLFRQDERQVQNSQSQFIIDPIEYVSVIYLNCNYALSTSTIKKFRF